MAVDIKKYIDWYKSGFKKFEQNLNGQASSKIHKIRKNAFESFSKNGFPTTRIEEWKYTNVDPIASTEFTLKVPESNIQKSDIEKHFFKNIDCYKIIFVNGQYRQDFSDDFGAENDFTFYELNDYINRNLKNENIGLNSLADFKSDSFVALNTAFMKDGIVIHIDKNKIIKKPFFLLYVNTVDNKHQLSQPRVLFNAETSSEAMVIESFQSDHQNTFFNNIVSEYQNQSDTSFHISNMFTKLAANSHFKTLDINIGGKISRSNIYAQLAGEGSESILNGIYAGNGNQHIDNRTVIEHQEPHCLSTQI